MIAAPDTERLIRRLSADLVPVRRLWPPWLRAAAWIGLAAAAGLVLALFADLAPMRQRLLALPDLRLAVIGSVLTAMCAGLSAFQLSVPGRSGAWILLPLPGAALWLAASGLGCLRGWGLPGLAPATMQDAGGCALFIAGVSIPLAAVQLWMLRRAHPLRPGRVAAMAGLAAAAASASLLTLFHPHDASAADLVLHAAAVGLVVVASRAYGGRAWGGGALAAAEPL